MILKRGKNLREISDKASNVASRSELRRFSLIINIYKKNTHDKLFLLHKNKDTVVTQTFCTSLELHYDGEIAFTIILSKYLNIMTCLILILII